MDDRADPRPAAPKETVPYVPAASVLPELTFKALAVGIAMAAVLGAANAWLGMRAGLTISATFPAAVLAIVILRPLKGSVLEENIARTTASVGEALAAGAIFTIPAFVLVTMGGERLWTDFNYWETSTILLVGGLLGVLFVILLRRTLVVEAELPFPEAYAAYEIVRAGQKGATGAAHVFGGLGVGAALQFLKNPAGFPIFRESVEFFARFPDSVVRYLVPGRGPVEIAHTGGIGAATPAASPALMGVGFIIGPRLAAINFCGGVLAWLVLIPLSLFLNPALPVELGHGGEPAPWPELASSVWRNQVRPLAVGAMLVGSLYTLWGLRGSILSGFRRAFRPAAADAETRLERDLDLRWILGGTAALAVPITFIYWYFTHNLLGALLAAVIMMITGFLFSGVGGWLVGLVGGYLFTGSADQPSSSGCGTGAGAWRIAVKRERVSRSF